MTVFPDRRQFLLRSAAGTAALAGLLARDGLAAEHKPHFAPKAKRVIYLFQSGGPSHLELFDYKPKLGEVARPANCPTRSAWASGSPA